MTPSKKTNEPKRLNIISPRKSEINCKSPTKRQRGKKRVTSTLPLLSPEPAAMVLKWEGKYASQHKENLCLGRTHPPEVNASQPSFLDIIASGTTFVRGKRAPRAPTKLTDKRLTG
jgi:hypothetical protein